MPQLGIEPDIPGSVIEHSKHKAKRSGPVRLVNYVPYIFTHIDNLYFALPHYYTKKTPKITIK